MNKEKRHTHIIKMAYELAESGSCTDSQHIEITIRSEGFEDARTILHDQRIRDELDRICELARAKKENNKINITAT